MQVAISLDTIILGLAGVVGTTLVAAIWHWVKGVDRRLESLASKLDIGLVSVHQKIDDKFERLVRVEVISEDLVDRLDSIERQN